MHMRKGYLIGSIVLFILSLTCIIYTIVEVIQVKYGLGSLNLWGAVVFHVVTAVIASFLLSRAQGERHKTVKEEKP
jgi:hypothetical protein